jgi:long-chain acyl-CoA synthetase
VNDNSIARAILIRSQERGSHLALTTSFGSLTGAELVSAVGAIAHELRRRYPGANLPVIIVMTGDPHTVAALLALDLVGRTAVLLHPAATEVEIRSAAQASSAELLLQSNQSPRHLDVAGDGPDDAHGLHWTDLSSGASTGSDDPRLLRQAGFLCHQTSGTVGTSKLALRSRLAVRTEMDALSLALKLTEDDVVLCGSAVSHSYGCVGGLLTPLLAGASVILARTSAETQTALSDSLPSIIFGLGPSYAELVDARAELGDHLRGVRFAFSAGARLPEGLFKRFLARFGVPIRQDYGTSETGTISLDLAGTPEPDCMGQILPHMDVRLKPPEGIPLEPGEEGEILVRSPALASGYLVSGGLSPCTDELGWYHTQDAGSWVGTSLNVNRRLRALPSIDGELINLDRVERAIQEMPGVVEVVISPETDAGRSILVAGVATRECTLEEIRNWCVQRLPRNWVPDRISVFERLPRTPAGKILRKYL